MTDNLEKLLRDEAEYVEQRHDAEPGPETTVSRPGRSRSMVYSVRLNPEEVAGLNELADQAGLPASTLVRSWILDRLQSGGASPQIRQLIHDEVRTAVHEALKTSS